MNKIKETYNYINDNWAVFDTCNPWSNPTDLYEEDNHLYVRFLPNCFDCESMDCDTDEYYDECTSLKPIIINEDGTINFEETNNIAKEYFVEHWSSF